MQKLLLTCKIFRLGYGVIAPPVCGKIEAGVTHVPGQEIQILRAVVPEG